MAAPAATLEILLAEVRELRREVAELRRGRKAEASLLSYRTAAKALGIDRHRLPTLVAEGRIRVVPGPRGEPRVPAAEVERIAEQGVPCAPAPSQRRRRAAGDAGGIASLNVRDL